MPSRDGGCLERTGARFQPTRWTLVDALRDNDDDGRRRAMEELVRLYWPAVYGFLRRSGKARDAAAECTQAFFADVVLRRGLFETADAARGRLRTLVLAALKRHLIDLHRSTSASERRRAWGVDVGMLDAEDDAHGRCPASGDESPDTFFVRRWAVAQLEEAMRRCERHFRSTGKARHWELFEARVVQPAVGAVEARPLAEAAAALGFRSAADGAAAVQVVRKRMLALLAEVTLEADESERCSPLER